MEDATKLYENYRLGLGTPMEIDYKKAYIEDKNIRKAVDQAIAEAQAEAERLAKVNGSPFGMCKHHHIIIYKISSLDNLHPRLE